MDYVLCFEKRVDSNGDMIIDVLLFNLLDFIEGLRVIIVFRYLFVLDCK